MIGFFYDHLPSSFAVKMWRPQRTTCGFDPNQTLACYRVPLLRQYADRGADSLQAKFSSYPEQL